MDSALDYLPLAGFLAFLALQIMAMRHVDRTRVSKWGILAAVFPNFVALMLFYSFAVHLYWTFDGWPQTIADLTGPPLLLWHQAAMTRCYGTLALVTIFVWPVALLICFFIRRLRYLTFYFGVYVFGNMAGVGLMMLAPRGFMDWWLD